MIALCLVSARLRSVLIASFRCPTVHHKSPHARCRVGLPNVDPVHQRTADRRRAQRQPDLRAAFSSTAGAGGWWRVVWVESQGGEIEITSARHFGGEPKIWPAGAKTAKKRWRSTDCENREPIGRSPVRFARWVRTR